MLQVNAFLNSYDLLLPHVWGNKPAALAAKLVWAELNPTRDFKKKHGNKNQVAENLPPLLWGACISCTPSSASSPSARLLRLFTMCQSSRVKLPLRRPTGCSYSLETCARGWLARVTADFFHLNRRTPQNVRGDVNSVLGCSLPAHWRVNLKSARPTTVGSANNWILKNKSKCVWLQFQAILFSKRTCKCRCLDYFLLTRYPGFQVVSLSSFCLFL